MSKRQKAFRQPIFIGYAKLNYEDLILHDIHCNGFGQIFFENLYPNQRFGVETVMGITVSTNQNHYITAILDVQAFAHIRQTKQRRAALQEESFVI